MVGAKVLPSMAELVWLAAEWRAAALAVGLAAVRLGVIAGDLPAVERHDMSALDITLLTLAVRLAVGLGNRAWGMTAGDLPAAPGTVV